MGIDKREQEQRDWTGYGSAERPVVVTYYDVQDDHEVHRLISINDYAIWHHFGDQATFELHLAARYRSVELVVSGKVIVKPGARTAILAEGAEEIKRRIEELQAKHPGMVPEPWMPEASKRKSDKTAIAPAIGAADDDPTTPSDSRENEVNALLAAVSSAIFDRIAPVVAGTVKQSGLAQLAPITEGFMWLRTTPAQVSRLRGSRPAEVDLPVVVALFPAGMRALITTRIDARIRVSRSAGRPEVSIAQCNEPAFLFNELLEPYDATDAIHLICDPAENTGYTFVMIEFRAGKFAPSGWVDGEAAARYAAEGAKATTGRPPDFHGNLRQISEELSERTNKENE